MTMNKFDGQTITFEDEPALCHIMVDESTLDYISRYLTDVKYVLDDIFSICPDNDSEELIRQCIDDAQTAHKNFAKKILEVEKFIGEMGDKLNGNPDYQLRYVDECREPEYCDKVDVTDLVTSMTNFHTGDTHIHIDGQLAATIHHDFLDADEMTRRLLQISKDVESGTNKWYKADVMDDLLNEFCARIYDLDWHNSSTQPVVEPLLDDLMKKYFGKTT